MNLVPFKNKSVNLFNELLNNEFFYGSFFPTIDKSFGKDSFNMLPALDVTEDKNFYIIKADLPGLKKEDINLSFNNGFLTIEGERKKEEEKSDKKYHLIERTYGKFIRSINLGNKINPDDVKAEYKDGILEVKIPKIEQTKTVSIEIK